MAPLVWFQEAMCSQLRSENTEKNLNIMLFIGDFDVEPFYFSPHAFRTL